MPSSGILKIDLSGWVVEFEVVSFLLVCVEALELVPPLVAVFVWLR
jgi:hypothetical protein